FRHGQIYNFWQDADHVRGILRRTTLASYASGKPKWTTVLDIDALAKAENANWVYKGSQCARPAERRCLINLSDGGEDAFTVREFDLATGKFVPNGFVLPKGKQDANWVDENNLLVSREWKPGELTRSGYAYVVKRWTRGQPLSSAVELFRGKPEDVGVFAAVLRDGENRTLPIISRAIDTFHSETYILSPKGVRKVAMPEKVSFADLVAGRGREVAAQTDEPAGQFNGGRCQHQQHRRPGADRSHQLPHSAVAVACERRHRLGAPDHGAGSEIRCFESHRRPARSDFQRRN